MANNNVCINCGAELDEKTGKAKAAKKQKYYGKEKKKATKKPAKKK